MQKTYLKQENIQQVPTPTYPILSPIANVFRYRTNPASIFTLKEPVSK